MGGDLLALLDDLVAGVDDRLAADRDRARAVGAHADRGLLGIAVDKLHILDRHAELLGDQLRERGLMALAMGMGAGQHLDHAGVAEADLGALPQADAAAQRTDHGGRRDATPLNVAGQADPTQLALGLRGREPLDEIPIVGKLECLVEMGFVVARVVRQRHRRLVREGIRGDEVLAAQIGRITPRLARCGLDDGLEQVGGLGLARAAIGVDRGGVGVHRIDRAIDRGRLVLPGEQRGGQIGRDRRGEGREIGPHIRGGVHLERAEIAVGVHRQLGVGDVVTAVGVRHETLGALRGPLDRPPDLLRGQQADALLGVDVNFRAEAAADVRRDHVQLVLRGDADECRDDQPRQVRVLAGGVQGERLVAAIVLADGRARLDRVRHEAIVDQIDLGDVGGAGDRLIHRGLVAELPLVDRVLGNVVVDLGLARVARERGRHARRQLFVVHLDQLGRVPGLMVSLGHHACDVIADVARLALTQEGVRPDLHVGAVLGLHHPAADQVAPSRRLDVVAGQHGEHTVRRHGPSRIDPIDPGMGMRRADEVGVDLTRAIDVVRVVAAPGDEAMVFLAPDGSADPVRGHSQLLMSAAAALIALTML
jgi:hypothetical protein